MRTTQLLSQHSVSEIYTIVFVLVDEYLKDSIAAGRFCLPAHPKQRGSYAELMTIALVGDLLSQRDTGLWYAITKREYAALFPVLPDRTRYYRILRNLERLFADFALCLSNMAWSSDDDVTSVIDSKPLPICQGARFKRPRRMSEASSGYTGTRYFYGFRLHALTSSNGLIVRFAITTAAEADPVVARALLADVPYKAEQVLGDKAYQGVGVYVPPKKNLKRQWPWTELMKDARQRIETVFSSLVRSKNLTLPQLNSFWSVRAYVCRKIAAFNLAQLLFP